jgi:hypothetical protein
LFKFNFVIIYKSEKAFIFPDALFRRNQNLPKNLNNERLQARIFQIFEDTSIIKENDEKRLVIMSIQPLTNEADFVRIYVIWIISENGNDDLDEQKANKIIQQCQKHDNIPKNPFCSGEILHQLWKKGIMKNWRYWLLR